MYANKWTCLNVVVSSIFYQIFDGLASFWTLLHFIEDDNGFAFMQSRVVGILKKEKNEIHVHEIIK